jgi:hypothetical protein
VERLYEREHLMSLWQPVAHAAATGPVEELRHSDELFDRDPVGRLRDRSIGILNFAAPFFVVLFQPASVSLAELGSST